MLLPLLFLAFWLYSCSGNVLPTKGLDMDIATVTSVLNCFTLTSLSHASKSGFKTLRSPPDRSSHYGFNSSDVPAALIPNNASVLLLALSPANRTQDVRPQAGQIQTASHHLANEDNEVPDPFPVFSWMTITTSAAIVIPVVPASTDTYVVTSTITGTQVTTTGTLSRASASVATTSSLANHPANSTTSAVRTSITAPTIKKEAPPFPKSPLIGGVVGGSIIFSFICGAVVCKLYRRYGKKRWSTSSLWSKLNSYEPATKPVSPKVPEPAPAFHHGNAENLEIAEKSETAEKPGTTEEPKTIAELEPAEEPEIAETSKASEKPEIGGAVTRSASIRSIASSLASSISSEVEIREATAIHLIAGPAREIRIPKSSGSME